MLSELFKYFSLLWCQFNRKHGQLFINWMLFGLNAEVVVMEVNALHVYVLTFSDVFAER